MKVVEIIDKDLEIDKFGNADYLTGVEAEKQRMKNFLQIFLGTWFDDLTAGVDWFTITAKGFTVAEVKAEITRALLELDFITKVVSINLGELSATREIVLNFVVKTTSGEVALSETI